MNIAIYIVATAIGLFLSYVGVVFAVLSGPQFAFLVGGLLVTAHIGTFIFVRKKAIQGKGRSAAIVLVSPLFIVMGVMLIFETGRYVVSVLRPDSPAFTKECQTAGAQYYKLPASPVHSIAYDWKNRYEPVYNYFTLTNGTRAESLQHRNYPYPATIEFTERSYLGKREGSPVTYIRFPRQGAQYQITALTADVLVNYQLTPAEELKKAATEQGMVSYELTVTDRHDGAKLAFLRYIVDAKSRRACGVTENNVMDERAFVLKAIGVQ
jgi:hypothetical protein